MQCTTQHWQSVGRSVGPVLIGQTGEKTPYIYLSIILVPVKGG